MTTFHPYISLQMLKFLTVIFVLVVAAAGIFAHKVHRYVHLPAGESTNEIEVLIEPGASFNNVANKLNQAGLIVEPFFFKLLAMYEEKTQHIKSGEYRFTFDQTPAEILDAMVSGKTVQYGLTVIEGKTFNDFWEQIQQHPKLEHTIQSIDDIKSTLGITQDNLEGLFLPETYKFTAGTKDIDILRQSYNLLRKYLDKEWPNRSADSFVSSPYEALILASIVEKETGVVEERPKIAGVFVLRLKKRMRLQTDPTVIYGIGSKFDGNITRKHLETDTPYNTYTRYGLPPTPIALPSADAIHAVLHPTIDGDLYFVSKGDGTHYFSKTYEQHEDAVRKYQLKK